MSRIVYSCLRGKVHAYAPAQPPTNPHLWVVLQTPDQKLWFATINVRSDKDAASDPVGRSYLYYCIDTDFSHPIVPTILARPQGISRVGRTYEDGAVDFQRGNLFDPNVMRVSPSGTPGDEGLVQRISAMLDVAKGQGADVFFYGNAFPKDNPHQTDAAFGYTPDTPLGIDCVHMAQGDARALDAHLRENGWWHDGACFLWEEHAHRMSAIFLAFQVQSWHTDDWGQPVAGATGHEAPVYDFSSGVAAVDAATEAHPGDHLAPLFAGRLGQCGGLQYDDRAARPYRLEPARRRRSSPAAAGAKPRGLRAAADRACPRAL